MEVRSAWRPPNTLLEPVEYCLLLAWGGPAVRVIGELDEHRQPITAHLEWQDWGTPWTPYAVLQEEAAMLLTYAQHFYFGE